MLCIIVFSSCQSKKISDKSIAKSFIDEVVIKNKDYNSYINLNEKISDEKMNSLNNLIKFQLEFLKNELSKGDYNYELLSHQGVINKNINTKFEYIDYSKVYHVVINNKIITSVIIDNKKVISFFYNLVKNKNSTRTPMILN